MNVVGTIAWKNLKRNKKRTIATNIGIIVSVALISFILILIDSFQASMIEATKKHTGNYHIAIHNISSEIATKFNQRQDRIEKMGISQTIGLANYKTQLNTRQRIRIEGYDETSLLNRDINLIEGRLPQNEREILISSYLLNNMNEPVKIGDKLTLNLRKAKLLVSEPENIYGEKELVTNIETEDEIEEVEYTITGIIEQTNEEMMAQSSYIAFTKLEQMQEERPTDVTILLKDPQEESTFYSELMYSRIKNNISENTELLLWQAAGTGKYETSPLFLLGLVAIVMVVEITIILVQNSFQMSISERMKEFGTLISIGATSKQIKRIVLVEGLFYALISIPIGLALGIGAAFLSTNGIGKLLQVMYYNKLNLQCYINAVSIIASVLITVFTILISCVKPIKEAKKASPIETIKQNNEIKVNFFAKKNKRKANKLTKKNAENKNGKMSRTESIRKLKTVEKTGKFAKLRVRLLGVEGEIAYKNIKRNESKYRSTTISISIMMILVILASTISQYVFLMENVYIYDTGKCNISVGMKYGQEQEKVSTVLQTFDRIKELDNIIEYSTDVYYGAVMKKNNVELSVRAYEGVGYEKYLKSLGLKYGDIIDKGILFSGDPLAEEGELLTMEINGKEYEIPIIKVTNLVPHIGLLSYDDTKIRTINKNDFGANFQYLIVSMEMAKKLAIDIDNEEIDPSSVKYPISMSMSINSSDPYELEREISQFINPTKMSVCNFTKQNDDAKKVSIMISTFLYGLLTVISLIGISNIYNTITASMHLRKREFEILKSIGMSNKQFKKMFVYESVMYGIKSIIYGIVLGIALNIGIYYWMGANKMQLTYYFPYVQTLVMAAVTVAVIHISTKVASIQLLKFD